MSLMPSFIQQTPNLKVSSESAYIGIKYKVLDPWWKLKLLSTPPTTTLKLKLYKQLNWTELHPNPPKDGEMFLKLGQTIPCKTKTN